jgi:predicted PurR-regulated permease PerM
MPSSRSVSPLFILVAIVVTVAALYFAEEILLPFALAVLLSFLLTPLANRLERWGLGRISSVLLIVASTFLMLGCLGWVVTSQLVDLSREMDRYKDNVVQKMRTVIDSSGPISRVSSTIEEVGKEIMNGGSEMVPAEPQTKAEKEAAATAAKAPANPAQPWLPFLQTGKARAGDQETVQVAVVSMPPSPLSQVQSWLGPIVAPLTAAGMVIVILVFMLIDRENQRDRLIQLFGTANLHRTTEAFGDASKRVSRYLRMQFLVNLGYGICVALGLWLIGVPSAAMWGVLGFSLRFLPYIGPWIAATLPILVSLAVSDGWSQPMIVVALFVVLELLLNNVVEPWLYGGSVGISSVGVIISAIFWTWIWGPIGLILAMPLTVCLLVMARYVPQLRFISVLLADRPQLSTVERVYQRMLAADENELTTLLTKELKSRPLAEVYDQILVPALALAEQDRHADLLSEDQSALVEGIAADLVEELGAQGKEKSTDEPDAATEPPASNSVPDLSESRVLCIPLRDEADETCAKMLAQLLGLNGLTAEVASADSLSSEVVEQVASSGADVVVISILPPIAQRETRLLWKRLRTRYPDLPIVIGCWESGEASQMLARIERDGPSQLVTSLADAVVAVQAAEAKARLAPAG